MHDRDAALLTRTAAALRSQGKEAEAAQLEAAVQRMRCEVIELPRTGYEHARPAG